MPVVKEWRECPTCHQRAPLVARVRLDADLQEWVFCRPCGGVKPLPVQTRQTTNLSGFAVTRAACRICSFRGTVTYGAATPIAQVACPRCRKRTLEDVTWDAT